MSVAIAVPSLNQGRFLGAALDSVLAQTGVPVDVAVLDGGSRDESLEVIRRYETHLRASRSGPDRGQAAAINEGLATLAGTRYVGWLNADDVLLPAGLARLAGFLDAHTDHVAVYGQAHLIDAAGRVIGEFPTRPFSRRALARTSIICQPASLITRRGWDAVGGLDESLHMCLDYDLWWRLSTFGPIGHLPEVVACSRDHDATKTRARQDRHYAEAFDVLRRHLGYVPWSWCVNESAYAWRASHGGRRAGDPLSQLACIGRAAIRYARIKARLARSRSLEPVE